MHIKMAGRQRKNRPETGRILGSDINQVVCWRRREHFKQSGGLSFGGIHCLFRDRKRNGLLKLYLLHVYTCGSNSVHIHFNQLLFRIIRLKT